MLCLRSVLFVRCAKLDIRLHFLVIAVIYPSLFFSVFSCHVCTPVGVSARSLSLSLSLVVLFFSTVNLASFVGHAESSLFPALLLAK